MAAKSEMAYEPEKSIYLLAFVVESTPICMDVANPHAFIASAYFVRVSRYLAYFIKHEPTNFMFLVLF
jgi:hypothetical protein